MESNTFSVAEQPKGGIGDNLDAGRGEFASDAPELGGPVGGSGPGPEMNGLDEPPYGSKVGGRYGELQQVFTTVLLAIVSAYGVTSSVIFTVIAAVLALLVTVVVGRKK